MKARCLTFVIMLLFWVLLSGMFDAFHFSLGLVSCALVAWFSSDLLFKDGGKELRFGALFGFVIYLPWLFWQIILSNLEVAKIVLSPRMLDLIDPQLVRFKTTLKKPVSMVTLAQSITLTPGTITVTIHDDEFTVYALTQKAASDLPGEMERRIAAALERGV